MREEVLDLFSIFLTKSAISPSEAITDITSTNDSSPDEGIVGGTSKRFNRTKETSKGLFFNADALLIQEIY